MITYASLKDFKDATGEDVRQVREAIEKWKAEISHIEWWIEKYMVYQQGVAYDTALSTYQNVCDRMGVGHDQEAAAWTRLCNARDVARLAKYERMGCP